MMYSLTCGLASASPDLGLLHRATLGKSTGRRLEAEKAEIHATVRGESRGVTEELLRNVLCLTPISLGCFLRGLLMKRHREVHESVRQGPVPAVPGDMLSVFVLDRPCFAPL